MYRTFFVTLFYFTLFCHYAKSLDSQKEEPIFIRTLFSAIKRLKSINIKQGINDDSYYNTLMETKNAPSVVDAVGFCALNGAHCDFLTCLADNFVNGKLVANLKKTEKLMVDNTLRKAIAESPQILRLACISGGLNELECLAFKEFLDLMGILDPDEAHVGDEPRDKRSPKFSETENMKSKLVNIDNSSMPNNYTKNDQHGFVDDYYDSYTNHDNKTVSNQTTTIYQFKNCTDLLKVTQLTTVKPTPQKAQKRTLKPKKGKKSD